MLIRKVLRNRNNFPIVPRKLPDMVLLFILVVLLVYVATINVKIFHGIIELLGTAVSFSILILAVSTYGYSKNGYFLFLGVSYGFAGFFNLIHTFMHHEFDKSAHIIANKAMQILLIQRFIEGFAFVAAILFINRIFKPILVVSFYTSISAFLLLSIFKLNLFPDCVNSQMEATLFNTVIEYVILALLLFGIVLLMLPGRDFDKRIRLYMLAAIVLLMIYNFIELLYIQQYGVFYIAGHFFKAASFYHIYKGIVETSIKAPFKLLFSNLQQANEELVKMSEELEKANAKLRDENATVQQSREAVQTVIDSISTRIAVLDKQGNVISVNKAWEGCPGTGKNRCFFKLDVGMNYQEVQRRLFHESQDEVYKTLSDLNELKNYCERQKTIVTQHPCSIDKELRWFLISVASMKGELGGFVIEYTDITEQKQAEAKLENRNKELHDTLEKLKMAQSQLVQQEKLAAIGQLAAGMAHEINNPLGFVMSNVETLEKYSSRLKEIVEEYGRLKSAVTKKDNAKIEEMVTTAEQLEKSYNIKMIMEDLNALMGDTNDGLTRIKEIVSGLRTFSRVDNQEKTDDYDLNTAIENTLVVAHNEIKYHADVEKNFGDIPLISATGGQINQVLLNIVINAVQAIKERVSDQRGLIKISTYREDGYVCCDIEDNGIGIPEENLNKIFNPFFTTKPVGQGTGLGLSISYDIVVNRHGGELLVHSTPGKGSIFTVKLPVDKR